MPSSNSKTKSTRRTRKPAPRKLSAKQYSAAANKAWATRIAADPKSGQKAAAKAHATIRANGGYVEIARKAARTRKLNQRRAARAAKASAKS